MIVEINKAEYLKDYKIAFEFSDGVNQTVDFEAFLRTAKNPMSRKYLDIGEFKKFHIEYGDIVWNDFEMCFPIWDLHQGKL
ncbi:DUF2442 domain-containing protein [Pedobacter endophyticus]|uniref:DUF2442 domain-containing protein n=1 Tax=Pedobacter endophyticus TaxID=2789740 RepID=A0A7U3SPA7_9SPHI|nr:DUF2442 domain-containing protein [Pedobacter endophyticus]QPH38418.1 DUF2442 domain-containing protein [Pedobacter endophyticus]